MIIEREIRISEATFCEFFIHYTSTRVSIRENTTFPLTYLCSNLKQNLFDRITLFSSICLKSLVIFRKLYIYVGEGLGRSVSITLTLLRVIEIRLCKYKIIFE